MTQQYVSPEERYDALVEAFLTTSDATLSTKKGFGSSALWISGKIFAMLVRGRLVVKLSRQRVDTLIATGAGQRWDPGHGRVMKEWLTIEPALEPDWQALATEAMHFVGSKP